MTTTNTATKKPAAWTRPELQPLWPWTQTPKRVRAAALAAEKARRAAR